MFHSITAARMKITGNDRPSVALELAMKCTRTCNFHFMVIEYMDRKLNNQIGFILLVY